MEYLIGLGLLALGFVLGTVRREAKWNERIEKYSLTFIPDTAAYALRAREISDGKYVVHRCVLENHQNVMDRVSLLQRFYYELQQELEDTEADKAQLQRDLDRMMKKQRKGGNEKDPTTV